MSKENVAAFKAKGNVSGFGCGTGRAIGEAIKNLNPEDQKIVSKFFGGKTLMIGGIVLATAGSMPVVGWTMAGVGFATAYVDTVVQAATGKDIVGHIKSGVSKLMGKGGGR